MLGKKCRPIIGKLSELLVSGNKTRFLNTRIPLDFKCSSPKTLNRYDAGGVGLGIVASLDKSNYDCCNRSICSSSLNRSNPINIKSKKDCDKFRGRIDDLEEDYTYVISHVPGKSSTKVYHNGDEQSSNGTGHNRHGLDDVNETSEARFVEDFVYPTSYFLSSCHLCRKKLHGKDIYMYRGEKGFCSAECRSRQIMMDERKEFCRSKASRSAQVSNLPYNNNNNTGQIFSTGILAI